MKTRKSSWRTTWGGLLAAAGTAVGTVAPAPFNLIGVGLTIFGQAMLGVAARDHKVTSAAAGLVPEVTSTVKSTRFEPGKGASGLN